MFTYEKQALEITNKMANVILMLMKHTRNRLSKTKREVTLCEYIEEYFHLQFNLVLTLFHTCDDAIQENNKQ